MTGQADPADGAATHPASWARGIGDVVWMLGIAAPPTLAAAYELWRGEASSHRWGPLAFSVGVSAYVAVTNRLRLARRLRTVSSVLASYREGDFSIRARTAQKDGLLSDLLEELNLLGETLREHRLGEMEAWALLRKVMAEVDVVVLAFDEAGRVRLANDAAARLLGKPEAMIVGDSAAALGVAELLQGVAPRTVKDSPSLSTGTKAAPLLELYKGRPWELRRGTFRLSGEPHTLVVLSDVSAALRDNENEAWRRLIRVMGHEINNSLAPIQSIAKTLDAQLRAAARPSDWETDHLSGLAVIGRRSEALGRFMASYAALARLPPPRLAPVDLPSLIRKVAALEQRCPVEVVAGADIVVLADADQIEQVLINLLKNAAEAALETRGGARLRWEVANEFVDVEVEDDGPGVSDTSNLFVPFFTTKPNGSGIGLVLSRQIAEAHGGHLSLSTRPDRLGSVALLRLRRRE